MHASRSLRQPLPPQASLTFPSRLLAASADAEPHIEEVSCRSEAKLSWNTLWFHRSERKAGLASERINWRRMKETESAVIFRLRLPTVSTVDETKKVNDAVRQTAPLYSRRRATRLAAPLYDCS